MTGEAERLFQAAQGHLAGGVSTAARIHPAGGPIADLRQFAYARRRCPLYPFETGATYASYKEVRVARASSADAG